MLRTQTAQQKGAGQAMGLKFNSRDRLPPVGVPLVLIVDGSHVKAIRLNWAANADDDLVFHSDCGYTFTGKYEWAIR